jgi:hypothetical protein
MPEPTEKTTDTSQQVASGSIPVESVLPANAGDSATNNDQLGFEPYVRALAEFLTNPATSGPLTVSVEGEWGSGKSSFMLQLEDKLRAIGVSGEVSTPHRLPLTIRFNAWRHDKDEALWAAFATEFARKVALSQNVSRRMWGHLRLFVRRFRWRQGWPDLVRTILSWLFVCAVLSLASILLFKVGWRWLIDLARQIPAPDTDKPETWSAWVTWIEGFGRAGIIIGYLTIIFSGWVKIRKYLGNPLETDLRKYLRSPSYEQRVSFIEQFHEDFSRIIDAYAGEKTIYVFIDDLDRCEIPKAAELMQAINLLVSGDQRGLIFIIGMDREKVAAGLAVKNEKLLPYLYISQQSSPIDRNDLKGLAFGYEFIEKFIQIPFSVPLPAEQNLENLFTSISRPNPVSAERSFWNRIGDSFVSWFSGRQLGELRRLKAPTGPDADSAKGEYPPTTRQEKIERREGLKLLATGDSERIQNIVLTMSPVLGNNPRRIKQFINLFRLKVFIAAETGLFDGDEALTLEQLGKFVAIGLRWPLFISDLETNGELLRQVQDAAVGLKPEGAQHWIANQELQRAVCAGSRGTLDSTILSGARWNLKQINVRRLLEVLPRVRTIDLRANSDQKTPTEAAVGPMTGTAHGTSTVSATLGFSVDADVIRGQTSNASEVEAQQQPTTVSSNEDEGLNIEDGDESLNIESMISAPKMEDIPDNGDNDWQRVHSKLSPLATELGEIYREALRILLRDGEASESFALRELQQQKLAPNWSSIFTEMQRTTNLVQPVPGQSDRVRQEDKEWQIRPALRGPVNSYLRRYDTTHPV